MPVSKGLNLAHQHSDQESQGARQDGVLIKQNGDEIQRLESAQEVEVVTLYGQKADLELKNQRLLATLQQFENASRARESMTRDPRESEYRHYHQRLWDLEQRNGALQAAAGFFKQSPVQSRPLPLPTIEETMEQIKRELASVLDDYDCTRMRMNVCKEASYGLQSLAMPVLGVEQETGTVEARLEAYVSEVGPPALIRTVVLAALKDWVFNAEYPHFIMEGNASLLLKSYRDTVFNFGM